LRGGQLPHARRSEGRDLAHQVSSHAAGLGIDSDANGRTQLELGLDTAHGPQLAPSYAALIGSTVEGGEPVRASHGAAT
jgi:4a-hydroxytetrahydrobiopterin dehydratase